MMHSEAKVRRGGDTRPNPDPSYIALPSSTRGYCIFVDGDGAVMATAGTLEEIIVGKLGTIVEQIGGKRGHSHKTMMVEREGPTSVSFKVARKVGGEIKPIGRGGTVLLNADHFAKSVMVELAKRPEPPHNIAVKTAAEVFSELVQTSGEKHEAFRREAIDGLTTFFARRNHGSDPLVRSAAMIEENARRRGDLIANEPMVNARQIMEMAGHRANNASATASRWKGQGKVFAIGTPDGDLFPTFQFADGKPLPVIASILAALPDTMSEWQVAFWFTSVNPALGMQRPADCLGDEQNVVATAEREALQLIG